MWRTLGVHINNVHANTRREHCRTTVADVIGLALRDMADIISGDWNQAGYYHSECAYHAAKYFENETGRAPGSVKWAIPGEPS